MYLDMNPDDFCANYDANEAEYIELIKQNFHNGEKVNTRPTIFFLMRNSQHGVDEAFEAIHQMDQDGKLSIPLKAFLEETKVGVEHLKKLIWSSSIEIKSILTR